MNKNPIKLKNDYINKKIKSNRVSDIRALSCNPSFSTNQGNIEQGPSRHQSLQCRSIGKAQSVKHAPKNGEHQLQAITFQDSMNQSLLKEINLTIGQQWKSHQASFQLAVPLPYAIIIKQENEMLPPHGWSGSCHVNLILQVTQMHTYNSFYMLKLNTVYLVSSFNNQAYKCSFDRFTP